MWGVDRHDLIGFDTDIFVIYTALVSLECKLYLGVHCLSSELKQAELHQGLVIRNICNN